MKKLVTALVALGLMAACVTPTLAAEQHKTKASCERPHEMGRFNQDLFLELA